VTRRLLSRIGVTSAIVASAGLVLVAGPASAGPPTVGVLGLLSNTSVAAPDPGVGVYVGGALRVDLVTGSQIESTITLPYMPTTIAVDSTTHLVYVAGEEVGAKGPDRNKGELSVINGTTVESTIKLSDGFPGLAVDSTRHLVYVTEYNKKEVLVGQGAISSPPKKVSLGTEPGQVVVDSSNGLAYVVEYPGRVAVLNGTTVIGTDPVTGDVTSIAADPVNDLIYVDSGLGEVLTILDGTTVVDTVPIKYTSSPYNPSSVVVDPSSGLAYVSDVTDTTSVSIFDGTTRTGTVELGGLPGGMGVDPSDATLFVSQGSDVDIVAGGTVTSSFPAYADGMGGYGGIAVDPSTHDLYLRPFSEGFPGLGALLSGLVVAGPASTSTTTSLTSSAPSATWGQPVTLTATVTTGDGSAPDGSVQFYVRSSFFGPGPGPLPLESDVPIGGPVVVSGGHASVTTSALPAGPADTITAVYTSPDGSQLLSIDQLAQPVSSTSTVLLQYKIEYPLPASTEKMYVSVNPAFGNPGTVQFTVNGADIGAPVPVNGSGVAKLNASGLPVGDDTLAATFTAHGAAQPSASDTEEIHVL